MLRASAARNGYDWLVVHQVALSGSTCLVDLFTQSNSAEASLASAAGSTDHERVEARQAGAFLRALPGSPRVLKIDVEGHEATVLTAASQWLADVRPATIIFESHDYGRPFFDRPLIALLTENGYQLAQLPKAKLRMRLVDLTSNADVGAGFDFVGMTAATRAECAQLFDHRAGYP